MLKTSDGFEYELEESAKDDWELIELMEDIDELEERPGLLVKIAKKLLGIEQYKKLREFCRDEKGTIRSSAILRNINSIMNDSQDGKNS